MLRAPRCALLRVLLFLSIAAHRAGSSDATTAPDDDARYHRGLALLGRAAASSAGVCASAAGRDAGGDALPDGCTLKTSNLHWTKPCAGAAATELLCDGYSTLACAAMNPWEVCDIIFHITLHYIILQPVGGARGVASHRVAPRASDAPPLGSRSLGFRAFTHHIVLVGGSGPSN